MYIKVSFLSKFNLTNKQKKQYTDKLFPEEPKPYDTKERNQGFIHKFNNAIGFKDVVGYYDNWNCYVRPKVSSPKDYITPERMLFNALRPDFEGKYILTFILKDDIEKILNVLKMVVDRNISIRQYSGGECTYHVKIEYLDDKKEDI